VLPGFVHDCGCRYESAEPHQQPLPGSWHEQLDGRFAALLLVKQLREEKLVFAAQRYVAGKLGCEFTEPEPWTLDGVFEETSARTPIIFILSTGGCCHPSMLKAS
jgi:dynein heavy chain